MSLSSSTYNVASADHLIRHSHTACLFNVLSWWLTTLRNDSFPSALCLDQGSFFGAQKPELSYRKVAPLNSTYPSGRLAIECRFELSARRRMYINQCCYESLAAAKSLSADPIPPSPGNIPSMLQICFKSFQH